jgi:sugar lactone lactonase YvrE
MKSLVLLVITACLPATCALAQFPAFPAADRVLGPPDFTSFEPFDASQEAMNSPAGVAVDPLSGKVFVSGSEHHRIMRFANSSALTNGASAEAVIGQTSYTLTTQGTTETTLSHPFGIDVDHLGRLWVADYDNNRVLMYEDAANLPEFGAAADLVLGRPDFGPDDPELSQTISQTIMTGPNGVHVDTADNLWVAEYGNNRVLKFANVSSLSNGAPATTVLGQPDFVTGSSGTSDIEMWEPVAVLVDNAGRLWVADQSNNRVLRFDNAAALGNGAAANGVLGQSDFDTATPGSTPQTVGQPSALAIDRAGTLYILDNENNRVLYHKNPASKANGAAPDGVIGQPDLTTITAGTTAQKLARPYGGLDFDLTGNLWVADYGNNRALRFPGDWTVASPQVKGKVPKSPKRGKLDLKGTAADRSGVAEVRYRVGKGAFKAASGTTAWKLSAKLKPGTNVIEIVTEDGAGNVSAPLLVKVKVKSKEE